MSKTHIASCQTTTSLSGHWKMYSLGLACVDLGLGGNKSGSLSPNCSDRNSNKFHWNSSNVRPRGSLWMLLKQFKFKPSRPPSVPLSVSPGWDFGKKRACRLRTIVALQSAGCWAGKPWRGRQMSLIVGLVQFPVAAGVDAAELNVWRQLTLSAGLVLPTNTGNCPPTAGGVTQLTGQPAHCPNLHSTALPPTW